MSIVTGLPAFFSPQRLTEPSSVPNVRHSRSETATDNLFVNNIRFLSMAGIIGVHTLGSSGSLFHTPSTAESISYFTQPLKFGTIGFFLISGFLLGERIDQCSPTRYFVRRLRNVFLPWLVWYVLFSALRLSSDLIHRRVEQLSFTSVYHACGQYLLTSPYWFVPNLLIALAIILALRKHLDDIRIGFAFLVASLFYSVNIYGHWATSQHTAAVFGFVFYLWLGAWSARHFKQVEKWIVNIPKSIVLALVLLSLALALVEMRLLCVIGSNDPANSLRISNQVYSVMVVLAIVRMRSAVWPRFINVRENTFGLYLTHAIALRFVVSAMTHAHVYPVASSTWEASMDALAFATAMFVITYAGSLVVVRTMMAHRSLRWAIGLPVKRITLERTINTSIPNKTISSQLPLGSASSFEHRPSRATG